MIIDKITPAQLIYAKGDEFIQKRVLPIREDCDFCKTPLIIDRVDDIFAVYDNGWELHTTCPVCTKAVEVSSYKQGYDSLFYKNYKAIVHAYVQKSPLTYRFMQKQEGWVVAITVALGFILLIGLVVGVGVWVDPAVSGYGAIPAIMLPLMLFGLMHYWRTSPLRGRERFKRQTTVSYSDKALEIGERLEIHG